MPLSGKATAICGLSPHPVGAATARAQMHLRQCLCVSACPPHLRRALSTLQGLPELRRTQNAFRSLGAL
jgi:hypothetical protein